MSRIEIGDLPEESKISKEEMKRVRGGASLVEYVLLVDLIPVVEIGTLSALGSQAKKKLQYARRAVASADHTADDEDDE